MRSVTQEICLLQGSAADTHASVESGVAGEGRRGPSGPPHLAPPRVGSGWRPAADPSRPLARVPTEGAQVPAPRL